MARAKNKRLGYGTDEEKDWDKEQYQRQQKILQRQQRIKKQEKTSANRFSKRNLDINKPQQQENKTERTETEDNEL